MRQRKRIKVYIHNCGKLLVVTRTAWIYALLQKWFGCGSFRTGGSGAVERKMDLSYYGSSEGILGLGSWVGQNNLTRKTERLDCWDLLT